MYGVRATQLPRLKQKLTDTAWKIPFAIQWIWPLPILIVCFFCPESPSWLVRHGRTHAAEMSLRRLQSPGAASVNVPTPAETVAQLVETDNIEKELVKGTTYAECFRGTNLRRTEIAVVTWVVQQMCGPVLQTYATYFYLQAGLATTQAFTMTLGLYALAFVGTCLSWPLIKAFGRRTIYLSGLIGIFVSLLIVGLIGIAPSTNISASWAIGSFLLIFTFIYDLTVGYVECHIYFHEDC
jgi:SP family general alpha glucoside:H+ symporter-like MFS transporter